mmetsp:Transcript_12533/g.35947  ORF Transcript_12533/g.35947 Transcript_12533/m.35947 type:complete len:361 (-) Transcript_12533:385-1467(-)
MGERLMTELFFCHKPDDAGELEDADLARLNRALAHLYDRATEASDAPLPPPEPLPRGRPLSFTAFRLHVHRALACLAPDADAKERCLEQLISGVRGKDFVGDVGGAKALTPREELERAAPEPEKVQKVAPCGPALFAEQRLEDVVGALGEGPAGDAARSALDSSRKYGAKAMELAKAYGESFSAMVTSSSLQEPLHAGQAAAMAVLSKVAPQQAMRCAPRTAEEHDAVEDPLECNHVLDEASFLEECGELGSFSDRAPSLGSPSLGSPDQVSFSRTSPAGGAQEEESTWAFDAGDGKHIDVRSHPDLGAPRTGAKVGPGERFRVSCELRGTDGVLYLQLADGRGWLFDHKPGFGQMCTRA